MVVAFCDSFSFSVFSFSEFGISIFSSGSFSFCVSVEFDNSTGTACVVISDPCAATVAWKIRNSHARFILNEILL